MVQLCMWHLSLDILNILKLMLLLLAQMAIGIISGAYSTEVFRGAIQSIDKGQFEAAKVLGVSKFATVL